MRARVASGFVRCTVCTHSGLAARATGACRLCGGAVEAAPAPPGLHEGWRCRCFQCTWTPC